MDAADRPQPAGAIEARWRAQFERDPELPTLYVAYGYVGDSDEVPS
jgi:hypothetical protein